MANKDNKDNANKAKDEKAKDEKVTVSQSPTPNVVQEEKGLVQDAKNPATIPYVEPMMQVTEVPNTYPPQEEKKEETPAEATIRADRGPNSVENTKGLERDPQHPGIVHSNYGHDRIETEAEKAARTGNAGVNLGQPQSVNAGAPPSKRLAAEQAAGANALARKHTSHAQEHDKARVRDK
jgi:hypothetical protein